MPTEAPPQPLPDDPRVAAMLALIAEERAALRATHPITTAGSLLAEASSPIASSKDSKEAA